MGNSNRPRNPYYEEDPYTRSSQQQNAPRQRASSGYGYGSQQSENSRTPSAPQRRKRGGGGPKGLLIVLLVLVILMGIFLGADVLLGKNGVSLFGPTATATPEPTATPTPAPTQPTTGSVKITYTSSVKIRQGPGTEYEVVGIAEKGKNYTCTGVAESGWYQVKTKEGVVGYISPKMCEFTPGEIAEDGTVTTNAARVQTVASDGDTADAADEPETTTPPTGSQTGQTIDFGLEIDKNMRR